MKYTLTPEQRHALGVLWNIRHYTVAKACCKDLRDSVQAHAKRVIGQECTLNSWEYFNEEMTEIETELTCAFRFPTAREALLAYRKVQPTGRPKADKTSYMVGGQPETAVRISVLVTTPQGQVTYEFRYTRPGLPTPKCHIVDHVEKHIVCKI